MSAEHAADLTIGEAAGLGLLQGLTEFLPVSSSGHLALAQYFLGLREVPVFFDVMLHVGTLAAVLVYFRGLIRELLVGPAAPVGDAPFVVLPDRSEAGVSARGTSRLALFRLVALLILGTLPVVLAVLAFPKTKPDREPTWRNQIGDLREQSSARPGSVLTFLGCTSVVLLVASRARPGAIDASATRWWHALAIGVAQSLSALCPGLSRSGMTISTSLLLGLRADWAVRFSLLLSIPAILGAVALHAKDLRPDWLTPGNLAATLVGTAVSAVVGFASIGWLARSVERGKWAWFAPYLWVLIAAASARLG